MKNLKPREKMLLAIFFTVSIVLFYFMLRIQPVRVQIASLQKQQRLLQKKLNKLKTAERAKGSLKKIEQTVAEMKKKMESESKTLEGYQKNFVDLQQTEKQVELKAAITRLIETQNLVILKMGEPTQSLDQLAGNVDVLPEQKIKRPMVELLLAGHFRQVKNLIQQLNELPYSVVVFRLKMNSERADDETHYQLLIELLLAL